MANPLNPDETRIIYLFAMIKGSKNLNFNKAIKYVNLSKEELKTIVNQLLIKNKISGKFEGDLFIIKSDVNEFIRLLEEKLKK